jgi:hypothetical protein
LVVHFEKVHQMNSNKLAKDLIFGLVYEKIHFLEM